jgi:large subunit ribosomal protein L29
VSPQKRLSLPEMRTAEAAELEYQLREARKRMFELRFKAASEEIADNKELSRLRRDVARMLTILNERRLGMAERRKAAQTPAKSEAKSHGH